MNDLTFGIRITADGKQLVGEVRASREEFDKLTASTSKMASQYSGLNQVVKEHTAAVTETSGNVTKLLDRYDPLGAKLRQLQADFKALDAAAASGKIAGRDDARVDAVYARLQRDIAAASAATESFSGASKNAALSAGQLRMATQMLPMQFTDIWVSLAAGQSPMMVMLQQGTQIKDSFGGVGAAARAMGGYIMGLINPLTLTAAAVAAGAYAFTKWEYQAVESSEKVIAAVKKAHAETERIAAMSGAAKEAAAASLEAINRDLAAQIKKLEDDPNRRFNWKSMQEETGKLRKEIAENEKQIGKLSETAAAVGKEWASAYQTQAQKKDAAIADLDEKYAREARNYKLSQEQQIALAREYAVKRDEIERQFAEKKTKGPADPTKAMAARIEADAFKAQMESMGVAAAQIKVYELARRGANEEDIKAAQADADITIAREAEIKASKASAAAWDESAKAIDKARTASAEYLTQLEFETSLLGLSTLEQQKRTEARRIDHTLEKELLALRSNDKYKDDPAALKAAEDATRQAAETTKAKALEEIDARDKVARSWEFGSKEAIRKYDEQVRNSAAQAEALYSRAFKGAEDAVTKFVMTGKADIRDFANAVIEEFVRINVSRPAVSAGAGMLGDIFGAIGGSIFGAPSGASASTVASFGPAPTPAGMTDYLALAGMRASGGPVDPGSLYRVNERGPELLNYGGEDYLMMGGRGGYVKPLGAPASGAGASASAGTVINLTSAPVINIDSRTDQAEVYRLVQNAVQHGNAQLVDTLQRQGVL